MDTNTAMATRYQHLTAKVQNNVAKRIGGLLWQQRDEGSTHHKNGASTAA